MRLEFDTSIPEIADTNMRIMLSSKMCNRNKWLAAVMTALFTGAAVYATISILVDTKIDKLVFTGFAAVAGAVAQILTYKGSMRKRLIKYTREHYTTEGPIRFAIELRDDCIWTKTGGTQISFDWNDVVTLDDAEDGVVLRTVNGGIVFIRSDKFESDEQRSSFVAITEQKMSHTAMPSGA